jgi:DNA anti-recombination protein RmuC
LSRKEVRLCLRNGKGLAAFNVVPRRRRGAVALEIDELGQRMTVHVTWKQVIAIAATVAVTIFGGYWLLVERVIDGVAASVSELRLDATARLDGREEEDRDIRQLVQDSNDKLRSEFSGLRAEIATLGDRIVASNKEIGQTLEGLRGSLITLIEKSDNRTEKRFDRLEEKLDRLIRDIAFPGVEKNKWMLPRGDDFQLAPEIVNEPR